jgi:DNA repair ATPase RecN
MPSDTDEADPFIIQPQLNASLEFLDESPIKLQGVNSHQRIATAKRKYQKTVTKIGETVADLFKEQYHLTSCKIRSKSCRS